MTRDKQFTVLVVDDEPSIRSTLAVVLKRENLLVKEAGSLAEATTQLGSESIDLVITDLRIGDDNGLDLIQIIKQKYPETESILVTAFGSIESSVQAIKAGACDYITKPFSNQEIGLRINKALEQKRMKQEILALRQHVAMSYGFDNIVGISKALTQIKETARRIAPTDITALITGPSGTGKELFARAIHHHSQRRTEPFIAIDCSAIPETLMESELFGHAQGAFTSASRSRMGLFEEADNGTIFLDEVSNMPQSIQVKLLRFLQDSVVRRIGASSARKINVRIVAATNRDLSTMVAAGEFREDLYYRLNVIPINLPPLVRRMEDIEILTDYFLRKIALEIPKPALTLNRAAIEKLLSHTWPGNVRELENTLKRAAALCTDTTLQPDDIIFVASETDRPTIENNETSGRRSLSLKGNLLYDNQKNLIIRALDENNWNYTKTATELGIGRTTLWRKIKKFDLKQEAEEEAVTD